GTDGSLGSSKIAGSHAGSVFIEKPTVMIDLKLVPVSEFERINKARIDKNARLSLLADMCRANTIASVKRAGSGHLGSSFSAMDIVIHLYYREMNTVDVGIKNAVRD